MNLLGKRFTVLALLLTTMMVLFSGMRYCSASGNVKVQRAVIAESSQRHQQQPSTGAAAIQCNGIYSLVCEEQTVSVTPPVPQPLPITPRHSFHPQDFYCSFFQPPR